MSRCQFGCGGQLLLIAAVAMLPLGSIVAAAQTVTVPAAEFEALRHEAQTARDVQEIQNLMARRAMLHSIGHNEEELELWSKKGEIRWAQNGGCWIGDNFRNYYVTLNYAMQKAALKVQSAGNPQIADDYAKNRYIGTTVLHILTTPLIEIAADGQSAKAFWYTPGAILSAADGKTSEGINMWERYGVDLVREDGQWRFLHIETITDFATPFGGTLGTPVPGMADASKSGSENAKQAPGPGAAGLTIPPPDIAVTMGESFSPTRVPKINPRLPEPYRTLADTFQYADCKARVAAPDNPDMTPVASQVDTNGDGHLSRAEWMAQGLPISSFNMFEKGRGYVTIEDYEKHAAPPGLDINGDGKVTVDEFKAFDGQRARGLPPRQPL